jgi:L-fuconolactonase
MRVDAHQHFWRIARGDYGWMEADEAVAPIRRDILPADIEAHLKRWQIDRTVLVQAAPTVYETEYMLGLADAAPFIGKVVGWVDFEKAQDRRHLERFAKHPKFAGVRPMIQDIADPDWMHRPDVQWGYDAIIDLDLTFDALGFPLHIDNFQRLFDRYPQMRIVIDHSMKPVIREGHFDDWAAGMAKIARTTPVFCKLSGLATEAAGGWTEEDLRPYAAHVLSAFGPERVMWGSDWPVLELAGTYDGWRTIAEKIVGGGGPAFNQVFGGTAERFYRLS